MTIARNIVAFVVLAALLQISNLKQSEASLVSGAQMKTLPASSEVPSAEAKARADVRSQVIKARSALWFTADFLGL